MKIVNICLSGSYNYGWGYQDNLMAKYQVKNGNDVTIITSRFINEKSSEDYKEIDAEVKYDNGVKVIRLEHGLGKKLTKLFRHYKYTYITLESEKPDFIFIHCVQFVDILYICKYLKKHKVVKCCADNHADYTNSARTLFGKIVHKTLWKFCAYKINKYVDVFYGVLPLRCDFLKDMYNLPKEKIKLLVMGADDELLEKGKNNIDSTRNTYGLKEDEFVIFTGGKIDGFKTSTLKLMKAVNLLDNEKVRLIIFGSVSNDIKKDFDSLLSNKVKYIGWLNQDKIYNLICASEFGFFPGRHSVIWEQVVAAGKPCAFKKIDKTNHVGLGGNCIFLEKEDEEYYLNILNKITKKDVYEKMVKKANTEKKNMFLYSNIARKPLEDIDLE